MKMRIVLLLVCTARSPTEHSHHTDHVIMHTILKCENHQNWNCNVYRSHTHTCLHYNVGMLQVLALCLFLLFAERVFTYA